MQASCNNAIVILKFAYLFSSPISAICLQSFTRMNAKFERQPTSSWCRYAGAWWRLRMWFDAAGRESSWKKIRGEFSHKNNDDARSNAHRSSCNRSAIVRLAELPSYAVGFAESVIRTLQSRLRIAAYDLHDLCAKILQCKVWNSLYCMLHSKVGAKLTM